MDTDAANRELRDLHQRLLANDKTASNTVLETFLVPLKQRVRQIANYRRYKIHDEHDLDDAVVNALFEFVEKPEKYDPRRSPDVYGFLANAAIRDLINAFAKAATRHRKHKKAVELSSVTRNTDEPDRFVADAWARISQYYPGETVEQFADQFFADCIDARFCVLMMHGERRNDIFAEVLGIMQPNADDMHAIKRRKDKIVKQLLRFGKEISHGD